MKTAIKTLYLLPHAHTDIGYSHDPLVTLELHDRFLDRALELCEATRGRTDGGAFRWTVEVLSSAARWWNNRGAKERNRLKHCVELGEIDVGGRYYNGTALYAPGDIIWEVQQLEDFQKKTGIPVHAMAQNDINGLSLPLARAFAEHGVTGLCMGINTTMGHSPFPRPNAFRWRVGEGCHLNVWNGWIYNRAKSFFHLDELASKLPDCLDQVLSGLPEDYPFDFALMSATMGDNIGPFVNLPEQVARFNAANSGVHLEMVTLSGFMRRLEGVELPVYEGDWPDDWTFGHGSMPQEIAALRRAQRRLEVIDMLQKRGWSSVEKDAELIDRARAAIALACEHTYASHLSSAENTWSPDAMRQYNQTRYSFWEAESLSMLVLRDHLADLADRYPKGDPRALLVNPTSGKLRFDVLTEPKGMKNFAQSRMPEHLTQFDREPTYKALASRGDFGLSGYKLPAESFEVVPLDELEKEGMLDAIDPQTRSLTLGGFDCTLASTHAGLKSLKLGGDSWEWIQEHADYPLACPIVERPMPGHSFLGNSNENMDPSDDAWNDSLKMSYDQMGKLEGIERSINRESSTLRWSYSASPLKTLELTSVTGHSDVFRLSADWCMDCDTSVKAYYLDFPFHISDGQSQVDFYYDACGDWLRVVDDQLPNTCNTFHEVWRGVAASTGKRTVYIISQDTPLFQFGGHNFGGSPVKHIDRSDGTVKAWIYNNYWFTNYPSASPGSFETVFYVKLCRGSFDPKIAQQLYHQLLIPYLHHPIC